MPARNMRFGSRELTAIVSGRRHWAGPGATSQVCPPSSLIDSPATYPEGTASVPAATMRFGSVGSIAKVFVLELGRIASSLRGPQFSGVPGSRVQSIPSPKILPDPARSTASATTGRAKIPRSAVCHDSAPSKPCAEAGEGGSEDPARRNDEAST